MEVLDLTNLELGLAYSAYGIVAMGSYFFGGLLADRFAAQRLMIVALVTTAIGGFIFAREPSKLELMIIYGYWGMTTILVFWAALIRSTRSIGGSDSQGASFGWLDGGRGLLAAALASVSVWVFEWRLGVEVETATLVERSAALSLIIWFFMGIVLLAAICVWFFLPPSDVSRNKAKTKKTVSKDVCKIIKMPRVWLQAIIVLCAYVAYKGTDNFSLYAYDVHGYNDVQAAQIGSFSFWTRPAAAILGGLIADRTKSSFMIIFSFLILILGSSGIIFSIIPYGLHWMLLSTVCVASIGIYALRGLYFALLEESSIPLAVTGTAVGLISVIGYTPDIFMGPVMGYLLDRSPGELGHQHVFGVVAIFAMIGLMATVLLRRRLRMIEPS